MTRLATRLLPALALLAAGCAAPKQDNAALELRVSELERQLGELQERLASVPDQEGLEKASLEELVIRLSREDVVSRYRAVRELGRRRPDEVQQILVDVIANGEGRERLGAASVFALEARPEAAPDLLRLHAEEKDSKVRALLALALGRAGAPGTSEAIMGDLDSDSRTVRLAAVQALDRLDAPESGGKLLVAALDDDLHVASAARGALERLPEASFHFVASEWQWLDPRDRVRAIELIGSLETPRVVDFLEERLSDAAPLVALAAARELALRGDDAGRELALERLRSDDPVVARAAREALDALGTRR